MGDDTNFVVEWLKKHKSREIVFDFPDLRRIAFNRANEEFVRNFELVHYDVYESRKRNKQHATFTGLGLHYCSSRRSSEMILAMRLVTPLTQRAGESRSLWSNLRAATSFDGIHTRVYGLPSVFDMTETSSLLDPGGFRVEARNSTSSLVKFNVGDIVGFVRLNSNNALKFYVMCDPFSVVTSNIPLSEEEYNQLRKYYEQMRMGKTESDALIEATGTSVRRTKKNKSIKSRRHIGDVQSGADRKLL